MCHSTLSGLGSDLLMLYFILGLLMLCCSCWKSLPKIAEDCQKLPGGSVKTRRLMTTVYKPQRLMSSSDLTSYIDHFCIFHIKNN